MSYTTEQLEYQKQLDQVNKKLNELNALLSQHPELKTDYSNNFSPEKAYYQSILSSHGISTWGDSELMLESKILTLKKSELEYRLKESKFSRNIGKISDIIPQHVSGRVYSVKDGDGCGLFCLLFLIVDGIICFIIYLFSL